MLFSPAICNTILGSDKLHFFYDDQQRPAKVNHNGTIYTYLHNLQGDIVGIVDGNGNLVVEYRYDAWGKLLSVSGSKKATLGKLNPFRYRGYVYDEETGLYYLRSRYYNPTWGRFISSDSVLGVLGVINTHNIYAYCGNNPIVHVDYSGHLYSSDTMGVCASSSSSMKDLVVGFFTRVSEKIGTVKNYDWLGDGTITYKSETKTVASNSAEAVVEQFLQIGSTSVMGVLSTMLVSNPTVGGIVAFAQYAVTEIAEEQVALAVPSIPEGSYTHETVEYREEVPGFFGYTYVRSCHYLHGYDVTGCTYFAIWEETYNYTAFGTDYSSRVLAQRAQ